MAWTFTTRVITWRRVAAASLCDFFKVFCSNILLFLLQNLPRLVPVNGRSLESISPICISAKTIKISRWFSRWLSNWRSLLLGWACNWSLSCRWCLRDWFCITLLLRNGVFFLLIGFILNFNLWNYLWFRFRFWCWSFFLLNSLLLISKWYFVNRKFSNWFLFRWFLLKNLFKVILYRLVIFFVRCVCVTSLFWTFTSEWTRVSWINI